MTSGLHNCRSHICSTRFVEPVVCRPGLRVLLSPPGLEAARSSMHYSKTGSRLPGAHRSNRRRKPEVLPRLQSLTTKIWQHAHNILTVCTLISLCIGSCHCQATAGSAKPDVLSPPTGSNQHLLSGCNEVGILKSLGWYQAYKPEGYSLNTRLPNNCSTATWQSLGCLASLVSLTLTGSLPHLPDHWWTNGSFSNLQVFNFSATKLAGTLPASWA